MLPDRERPQPGCPIYQTGVSTPGYSGNSEKQLSEDICNFPGTPLAFESLPGHSNVNHYIILLTVLTFCSIVPCESIALICASTLFDPFSPPNFTFVESAFFTFLATPSFFNHLRTFPRIQFFVFRPNPFPFIQLRTFAKNAGCHPIPPFHFHVIPA